MILVVLGALFGAFLFGQSSSPPAAATAPPAIVTLLPPSPPSCPAGQEPWLGACVPIPDSVVADDGSINIVVEAWNACDGSPIPHDMAFLWTCRTDVDYLLGHADPGVFGHFADVSPGFGFTWTHNGVRHHERVMDKRQEPAGWQTPIADATVMVQTCTDSTGLTDWILDAGEAP